MTLGIIRGPGAEMLSCLCAVMQIQQNLSSLLVLNLTTVNDMVFLYVHSF
jgi:hypothetical protein